jgi:hypothetical protein
MSSRLPLIGSLVCLSIFPTLTQAAGGKVAVSDVRATVVGTPMIQPQIAGMAPKRPRPGEPAPLWVEVEADFDCAEEFPELTIRYGLVIAAANGVKLIEGESTLIDVGRGKDRHSVMYITPKTLNKITGGKPFQAAQIKASWVEILAQNEQIGAKFKSSAGVTYEGIQKEREKGTIERFAEGLVNKQHTPFAPLFWDYYETVRPGSK